VTSESSDRSCSSIMDDGISGDVTLLVFRLLCSCCVYCWVSSACRRDGCSMVQVVQVVAAPSGYPCFLIFIFWLYMIIDLSEIPATDYSCHVPIW
jgi:hypothetical protein